MSSVQIKIEELPDKVTSPQYGIRDFTMLHICEFYKKFSQKDDYLVDVPCDGSFYTRFIFDADYLLYNQYGIYFNVESIVTKVSRKYMLIMPPDALHSEEAFCSFVQENKELLGDVVFDTCIIEEDFSIDSTEAQQIRLYAMEYLPTTTILNPGFEPIYMCETNVIDNIDLSSVIDVTSLFQHYNTKGINFSYNLQNAKSLVIEMEKLCDDKKIFYADFSSLSISEKFLYVGIAACMTMQFGQHFYVPQELSLFYFGNLRKLTGRTYNYLSDYLNMLSNPVDVAAMISNGGYICVKNYQKLFSDNTVIKNKYKITLHSSQVAFNLDTLSIDHDTLELKCYDLDRIEVLAIQDIFDLANKDFAKALDSLYSINALIAQFEEIITTSVGGLHEETLNCTNVLLYKFNDKTFLGYVSNIEACFPYTIMPICKGYKPFSKDLNLKDFNSLLDIRVFDEYKSLLLALKQQNLITGKNMYFKTPEHYVGILLSSFKAEAVKLTEECGFSIEEIGMWSQQTAQCRNGLDGSLLNFIPAKSLRSRQYLSYYAGMHPSMSVNIWIDPSSWRG